MISHLDGWGKVVGPTAARRAVGQLDERMSLRLPRNLVERAPLSFALRERAAHNPTRDGIGGQSPGHLHAGRSAGPIDCERFRERATFVQKSFHRTVGAK